MVHGAARVARFRLWRLAAFLQDPTARPAIVLIQACSFTIQRDAPGRSGVNSRILGLLCSVAAVGLAVPIDAATYKLNVLLIMADDLRADLGCGRVAGYS